MGMRYYPHPPPLEGEPLSKEVILSLQGNNSGRWGKMVRVHTTPSVLSWCGVWLCMFANVIMGQYWERSTSSILYRYLYMLISSSLVYYIFWYLKSLASKEFIVVNLSISPNRVQISVHSPVHANSSPESLGRCIIMKIYRDPGSPFYTQTAVLPMP